MSKKACADCGRPKEVDATSISYCNDCRNRRARKRYAAQRAAQGHAVQSRSAAVDAASAIEARRQYLVKHDGSPGKCEVCDEYEPSALTFISIGDRDNQKELYAGRDRYALLCQNCRLLTKVLDDAALQRTQQLAQYLRRHDLTLKSILPDLQDVIMGTVPTPLTSPTPTPNKKP